MVRKLLSDGGMGKIDLAHFAATLEAYYDTDGLPSDYWAGWGGDLATEMRDVTDCYENSRSATGLHKYDIFRGKSLEKVADMVIENEAYSCNYSDMCSDFDAYAIFLLQTDFMAPHELTKALSLYYYEGALYRFDQIIRELQCEKNIESLSTSIINKIIQDKDILMSLKANKPTDEVITASCNSFSKYIISML